MNRHSALLGAVALLFIAQLAHAAGRGNSVHAYVACGRTKEAEPSSRCSQLAKVGAFFKSPYTTKYRICVRSSRGFHNCERNQTAEANIVYVNSVRAPKAGKYTVTWSFNGERRTASFVREGRAGDAGGSPSIFQIIGAASGVVAIIGTVTTGLLRHRRPRLQMSFDGPPEDATTVSVSATGMGQVTTSPSHWLRLRVTNRRGARRRSATEVEARLLQVAHIVGEETSRTPLDSAALIWSNQSHPSATINIPPGESRHVDVGVLRWPEPIDAIPAEGSQGCWVELQVLPKPSSDRDRLQIGTYRLELSLSAKDVSARRYQVLLDVNGEWHSGSAVWRGFRLHDLRRVRRWGATAKKPGSHR